jgi:hypothetical protein
MERSPPIFHLIGRRFLNRTKPAIAQAMKRQRHLFQQAEQRLELPKEVSARLGTLKVYYYYI